MRASDWPARRRPRVSRRRLAAAAAPEREPQAIPIGGTPGTLDAITDVAGIEVGHTTLISAAECWSSAGPVRTGVTVAHPRGRLIPTRSLPLVHAQRQRRDDGRDDVDQERAAGRPVAITNTQRRRGARRDHPVEVAKKTALQPWWLPIVAETYDGRLNDINGFHVARARAVGARQRRRRLPKGASAGAPAWCHGFKGGIGTASRAVGGGRRLHRRHPVQCNYGGRRDLHRRRSRGRGDCRSHSVHRQRRSDTGIRATPVHRRVPSRQTHARDEGSIIVVVATDAPLLPHQLKRAATRVSVGLGRQGGSAAQLRDIFVASPPPTRAGSAISR